MSTNYYLKPAPGNPLALLSGDANGLHLGLKSGGWSLSVQAYRHEATPEKLSHMEVSPGLYVQVLVPATPALKVESWSDWKQLILEAGAKVFDEYAREIDAAEFISDVETHMHPTKSTVKGVPLLNHCKEVRKRGWWSSDDNLEWQDAEGFSVSLRQFS
jgi:hypothetical protein